MPPSAAATVQGNNFVRVDEGMGGTKGLCQCNHCDWKRFMSSASHAVNHILGGHRDIPKCGKVPTAERDAVQKKMFPSRWRRSRETRRWSTDSVDRVGRLPTLTRGGN